MAVLRGLGVEHHELIARDVLGVVFLLYVNPVVSMLLKPTGDLVRRQELLLFRPDNPRFLQRAMHHAVRIGLLLVGSNLNRERVAHVRGCGDLHFVPIFGIPDIREIPVGMRLVRVKVSPCSEEGETSLILGSNFPVESFAFDRRG